MSRLGTGKPRREFLHVDDLADALVYLIERYSDEEHVNVGWGTDISIAELVGLIAEIVGFKGTFRYASEKPDGAPRKLLDISKLSALGWRHASNYAMDLAMPMDGLSKASRIRRAESCLTAPMPTVGYGARASEQVSYPCSCVAPTASW